MRARLRLYLLAAVLFGGAFALHPSLHLAVLEFPSFRIGVYQLAMVGLVVSSLPLLWHGLRGARQRGWTLMGLAVFGLSLIMGLSTSLVPLRTALYTASLLGLLLVGVSAGLTWRQLNRAERERLVQLGLWSGIVIGLLSIGQLVVASFEPTALGTLCRGCHAGVFGFVRVNGLAAEPQFLASSLLPALLLAAWQRRSPLTNWSLLCSSLAVALTFSRGAFVALASASLIFIIWMGRRRQWRQLIGSISLILVGTLLGLGLLLGSAVIRHHQTPHIAYNTAVSMLEQLSLGRISLPQKTTPAAPQPTPSPQPRPATPPNQPTNPDQPAPALPSGPKTFRPAGFVEASSDDRLTAAQLALQAWTASPRTILFGAGLGNLGSFLAQQLNYPVPIDQTVYIFYVLLLGNLGLCGFLPLAVLLGLALWRAARYLASSQQAFGLSLGIAIMVQFWFFGSLINAAHCFAWIGILLYNHPNDHAEKC